MNAIQPIQEHMLAGRVLAGCFTIGNQSMNFHAPLPTTTGRQPLQPDAPLELELWSGSECAVNRVAPDNSEQSFWQWSGERIARIRELGIRSIAGILYSTHARERSLRDLTV